MMSFLPHVPQLIVVLTLLAGVPTAALSQSASQRNAPSDLSKIVGTLISVDHDKVTLRTSAGQRQFTLDPKALIVLSTPASLSDVKPGTYVGVESAAGVGEQLEATEIHIFADNMRGMGEGHRGAAGSRTSSMTNAVVSGVAKTHRSGNMTNATVSKVGAGSEVTVELTYSGGGKTVRVPRNTSVRHLELADRSALTEGREIVVFAGGPGGDIARLVRVLANR